MITRWRVAVGLIALVLAAASPVGAHSALIRANPSPNAMSSRPPEEIRLWFSEALEPEFSRITLRDSQGNPVGTMPSQVAAEDHEQMFLIPGQLPDGMYTVVWSAVSAVDAHQTQGSFAFTVGAATGAPAGNVEAGETEALPLDAALIRWFGLLSMAVSVGSLGFWLFVWTPVMSDSRSDLAVSIRRAIWVGWGLLGISAVLTLALQAATVTGAPLTSALVQPELGALMNNTRFGSLWLVRMALWLSMGIALLIARRDRWFDGAALLVGAGILLTTSLYSHADAARDEVVSVAADWLHLTATALWVGGLIGFLLVIVRARRNGSSAAPMLASLVAQFSIFARVAVAALTVTGVYMAWLQVGTPDALLTTRYGQVLLVKLMLMIPLLTVAGINLVYTQRGLRAGKAIWTLRLRRLVGMEIGLTAGVLLAVGVMTSIAPARSVLAAINSVPTPSQKPYYDSILVEDANMHVDLQIAPGWVGANTFTVYLYGHDGSPIDDASLIRLRFDNAEARLGTSELRPAHTSGGMYEVSGANLSVPGKWRIRATIQRPGQYDTVVDFEPEVESPPVTVPATKSPQNSALPNRFLVLVATGVLGMALGGFFLGQSGVGVRRLRVGGAGLLALALLMVGLAFLVSGIQAMEVQPDTESRPGGAPDRVFPKYETKLPYLLTTDGTLLQPGDDGLWHRIKLDFKINDLYREASSEAVWVATDSGLKRSRGDRWETVDNLPVRRVTLAHGYIVALGDGKMSRLPSGDSLQLKYLVEPDLPLADQPGKDLVMLASHSFVLQSANQVFDTPDVGLSWQPLDAPQSVSAIGTDLDGGLLAVTAGGVLKWDEKAESWNAVLPLPDGIEIAALRTFENRLYTLAGGRLYVQNGQNWKQIELPGADESLFTSVEFQYPDRLWVLGANGARLWSTIDGENWTVTAIRIGDQYPRIQAPT